MEEKPGSVDIEGNVSELIEDDEVRLRDVVYQLAGISLLLRLAERTHEIGGGPPPDFHAPLRGQDAQSDGQVRLAAPGFPEEYEVLRVLHEVEVEHPLLAAAVVEHDSGEIEPLERFHRREFGPFEQAGAPVLGPRLAFLREQEVHRFDLIDLGVLHVPFDYETT